MLWLAQRDLMPSPPLPRAEAERHRIRPSCLLLLTGLLLLARADIAFADTAADANAAYQRGDYATAIELFRSLAEQGDSGNVTGHRSRHRIAGQVDHRRAL